MADSPLGHVRVKLLDLLEMNGKEQDWFPLSGAKSGRVRVSAQWNPVAMAGAINGAGAYTPPIGVVRVLYVLFSLGDAGELVGLCVYLWGL